LTTVRDRLEMVRETTVETARQLRQGYQSATVFARMRIWIVGALVADLVVVILTLAVVGRPDTWVEVGLQTGFPGDMVILHNLDDDPLRDVRVVLDGRYEASVPRIEGEETVGLELVREFHDEAGHFPPASYRPEEARVEYGGRSEIHSIETF